MLIIFGILFVLIVGIVAFLQHPQFGAKAQGYRRERMEASRHYRNGRFHNLTPTPPLTKGYSMPKVMFDFFFRKSPRSKPKGVIPFVRHNLKGLPPGDWLVWFGHSSYFIRTCGLNILVDPVFSGSASPLPGSAKAFKGTNKYLADDMPVIDYLLITHDHYDHLDYKTIVELQPKIKKVICGLGVGAHLIRWGISAVLIYELDWYMEKSIGFELKIRALPARHFSGRLFRRNQTLWVSYLLETPDRKIFIQGDGGYDTHFKEIGEKYGPIDLAILENGQYNKAWHAIHFLPGENLQAAADLKAKRVMPVHSSKFDLSLHAWDEPLNELVRHNEQFGFHLITPMIGQLVDLKHPLPEYKRWWEEVDG